MKLKVTELNNMNVESSLGMSVMKKIKTGIKLKREEDENNSYMDVSFIVGSIAEIERLWSFAKLVYSAQIQRMSPMMLEALLFLRTNEQYWGPSTVSQAIRQ